MFSRIERLTRRPEYLRVAASGKMWVAPGLILQACENINAKISARVGLTVSRRVGNSVARNRARRRLRAVATAIIPKHAIINHDLVLIGRKNTIKRPFNQLLIDLETSLKQLNVWRDE